MDISRFNGLRFGSNVCPFLLSLLDSLDLGNSGSGESIKQSRCETCISLLGRLRRKQRCLRKNQLRKRRPRVCTCRSSSGALDREVDATPKGSSSHWINSNDIITGKFAWGTGYGAFSVSESNVGLVARYIADQEEHNRVRTFAEELKEFIDRDGLHWKDEVSR